MIEKILEERGDRYGAFNEHSRITQEIKDTLRSGASWYECSDSQMEALDMIAHKMGRIVNGDPEYDDSWIDIIGYSQLVLDELNSPIENFEEESLIEDMIEEELVEENFGEFLDDMIREAIKLTESVKEEPEDKISEVEINGVQVFIKASELKKLDDLKESTNTTDEPDHNDQTYIEFDDGTMALSEQEYEDARKRLQAQGIL